MKILLVTYSLDMNKMILTAEYLTACFGAPDSRCSWQIHPKGGGKCFVT